jgi:uncharacterized SAM-binding protein YcdF (DUF218 family)
MILFLSKLIPIYIYPLGLACTILLITFFLKAGTRWIKTGILVAFALLWLGGNRWVSLGLKRSLEWQYFPPEELPVADAIVVLGGGTEAVQYPRPIVELNSAGDRVLYAGWLYHQGVAPNILLSGGVISWTGETTSTPAEEMSVILEMLDVPVEALWLESESRNTYENALRSKEILARRGIDRIVLVTSATHMPRAVGLFEKQELIVIPAPTDYTVDQANWDQLWVPNVWVQLLNFLPSANNLSGTTAALKEYIGIIVSRLSGWL